MDTYIQCPTTIVPFFGDQFFWGDRIHEKGLGPAPIPISELTIEALSDAIKFMLQPEVICVYVYVGVLKMIHLKLFKGLCQSFHRPSSHFN